MPSDQAPPLQGTVVDITRLEAPVRRMYSAAEATMEIKKPSEISADGYELISVPVPGSLESLTPLQTAIIMQSTPMWATYDLPFLLHAQLKCKTLSIDPLSGEVYPVDGRLNTTDRAKIRHARNSGKIKWVKVGDPIAATHPITLLKDFYVLAEMKHADEDESQSYKAWFSEWNNPKNDNWAKRPVESLQRKAVARLSDRMFPIDDDDFVPVTPSAASEELLGNTLRTLVAEVTEMKAPTGLLPEHI